jgi:hypothetical protein
VGVRFVLVRELLLLRRRLLFLRRLLLLRDQQTAEKRNSK